MASRFHDRGRSATAVDHVEVRTNRTAAGRQARRALKRAENERDIYADCATEPSECHPKLRSWRDALEQLGALDGLTLLRRVNVTMNELIRYRDDPSAYGEADYWATPIESLTGHGDCEDYAILKYLSLRELGFSARQLRIRIVFDSDRNVGHAILTVELARQTYVLDSLSPEPKQQTAIDQYKPHYSVNENGQWLQLPVRNRNSVVAIDREQ